MLFSKRIIICFFALILFSCNQKENKNDNKQSPTDTLQNNVAALVKSDQSTLDMSWCPANYPLEQMQGNKQKLIARVIYSRPQKKGRQIFGTTPESLCVYGKPWRLGANEATEITFFENINIAGKDIEKGTYVLYCIPNEKKWSIILNTNLYTWGLHIDETKDIFKTDIPTINQAPSIENFTLFFEDTKTGCDMVMAWDNVKTVLPIGFVR
jgi:Protein of unknown function (DUF2911)